MRKSCFLVVMSIGTVLGARQSPNSINALRQALGGDAALRAVARLHITATVNKGQWNQGSLEAFAVLPGRFVQEIDTKVYPGAKPPQLPKLRDPGQPTSLAPQPSDPYSVVYGLRGDDGPSLSRSILGFFDGGPLPRYGSSGKATRATPGGAESTRGTDLALKNGMETAHRALTRWVVPLLTGGSIAYLTATAGNQLTFTDNDGGTWQLTLDASSRPASVSWGDTAVVPGRTVRMTMSFSDYRPVTGGRIWPHHIVTTADDYAYEDLVIKHYEINGRISDSQFRR
jgi:hypothetical protein